MTAAAVTAGLFALAFVDAALAGFRSSAGHRPINHRAADSTRLAVASHLLACCWFRRRAALTALAPHHAELAAFTRAGLRC